MQYFFAIIAGLIQGVAEFIPVSSSGHLIIFHDMFRFNLPDNVLFDVTLHLGTALALIIVLYKDILKVIRGFFSSLANRNLAQNYNQRLAWLVIIGTIPAGILGYLFDRLIEKNLHNSPIAPLIVATMLIGVAVLFFIAEKYAKQNKTLAEMNKKEAFILGCAQATALIPGTSRSGITIIAGLWKNLKRSDAARFSFLLSVPAILGAGLVSAKDISDWHALPYKILAVGFLAAAISGYFSVKYLLRYFSKHTLRPFAWYRIILGLIIVIWVIFR